MKCILALPDVAAEFHADDSGEITLLRSSPQGAFYADLRPGRYRVTLSKTVEMRRFISVCCAIGCLATCGRSGCVAAIG